jgi:hypothetical protein
MFSWIPASAGMISETGPPNPELRADLLPKYTMAQIRCRIQCDSRALQGLTKSSHGRKPVENRSHNQFRTDPGGVDEGCALGCTIGRPLQGPDRFMRAFLPWVPPTATVGPPLRGYDGSYESVTVFRKQSTKLPCIVFIARSLSSSCRPSSPGGQQCRR